MNQKKLNDRVTDTNLLNTFTLKVRTKQTAATPWAKLPYLESENGIRHSFSGTIKKGDLIRLAYRAGYRSVTQIWFDYAGMKQVAIVWRNYRTVIYGRELDND